MKQMRVGKVNQTSKSQKTPKSVLRTNFGVFVLSQLSCLIKNMISQILIIAPILNATRISSFTPLLNLVRCMWTSYLVSSALS